MEKIIAKQAAKQTTGQAKKKMNENIDKMKKTLGMGKEQKDKKKKKGRPSMLKEEDKKGVPRPVKFSSNPEYRSIENWNYKLENMLVILQAGDDSKVGMPLDEF